MMAKSRAAEVNAYGFTNAGNTAGGLEAWSGELQASNVPLFTVEFSNNRRD